MKAITKKYLLFILFIAFLTVRLFVSFTSVLLGEDSLKFMEAAKNFPYHTLYNEQLYTLHPPLYPYIIHIFTFVFNDDYLAAIAISIISAIVTFFVLFKFFMMLSDDFNVTFIALVFFTLSVGFVIAARVAIKESFVIMLIFLSLYFYIKGLKFSNKKSIAASSLFALLLASVSDHVVFIFPAFLLAYLFFNSKKISLKKACFPNLGCAIVPFVIALIAYGSWLAIKYHAYSKYEFYPAGYAGIPISIKDLGLLQTISPQFFEDYRSALPSSSFEGILPLAKRLIFNLGYLFNMEPFSIPQGLNFTTMKFLLESRHLVYMALIYLPLAVIACYWFLQKIKNFIKSRKAHNNVNLFMICMFLILAFPITQKYAGPRYIYSAYIFFFYLLAVGIVALVKKESASKFVKIVAILLLILVPFWIYSNNHFLFSAKKVVSANETADFINKNLPKGVGLMAQPGHNVNLIYLTGNRQVGLYPGPERLSEFIERYNISYIVFSRYFTWDAYHFSKESVEHIKSNPDKFKIIAKIKEDNTAFSKKEDPKSIDEVYIYEVIRVSAAPKKVCIRLSSIHYFFSSE